MTYISPLRYPGGKGKLANYIKLVFRHNNLINGEYVEPYAGGAGVALALLYDDYVRRIHINDVDRSIYAFWHSVVNNTDELCRRIRDTNVTLEEWQRQKDVQRQAEHVDLIDLGFSTFFLNRTNRSGILDGGVIGGQAQTGTYLVNARYNKSALIERIQKVGRYRRRIHIYQQDAAQFIQNVVPTLVENTLVYLDPPYYVKGQHLYTNYYQHKDHVQIASFVQQILQYWIVSYDKEPSIEALYSGYEKLVYELNYSAAERRQGSEIMFFCPRLNLPAVTRPTGISHATVNRYQETMEI